MNSHTGLGKRQCRGSFVLRALVLLACGLGLACCGGRGPATSTASLGEEIGSLRNARVAYPMPAERVELTYFAFDMPDDLRAQVAAAASNVRLVIGLSREEALARATEAHAVDARYVTPQFVQRANNLVWIMSGSAGVDRYIGMEALKRRPEVVLTNMRAVHGPAIADHVFAMLLSLTRDLRFYAQSQEAGVWSREGSGVEATALKGRTMLVVGLGGIGTEVARRAKGFDMRVIATRRSAAGSASQFVDRVELPDKLLELLPEADVVVICVPLTPETDSLFDAKAFAAMKPRSYLVNIARGRIVNTDALMQAISSGRLAGACLDVTDPEPLPSDHPLWRAPNVLITPHVASDAEITGERWRAALRENLRRFGAGEPLLNVVDIRAGY